MARRPLGPGWLGAVPPVGAGAQIRRWWHEPDRTVPLQEGAPGLLAALRDSIAVRVWAYDAARQLSVFRRFTYGQGDLRMLFSASECGGP
ncbi:hypothetical protein [Saccharopolyspora pogona]|uniref:hypothetical protein n=1 Tax=Saccharopolyspora pogona TaxID=333966 RepID=UPI001CC2520A|nr:hypothetical protein [Saccharopolyspora pogona]